MSNFQFGIDKVQIFPSSFQVTGHIFEVETETFKLRNIMEAPLLKCKEEIEVRMGDQEIYHYAFFPPQRVFECNHWQTFLEPD